MVVVRALIRRPAIDSEQAGLVCFLILIIPVVRDLPPTVDGPALIILLVVVVTAVVILRWIFEW